MNLWLCSLLVSASVILESSAMEDNYGHYGNRVNYIRWGRSECPMGANEVYKGFAAGAYHGHAGGGANYLCLTENPAWDYTAAQSKAGWHGLTGWVYGAEYETTVSAFPFKMDNNAGGASINSHDVPCVACDTFASQLMMIPGTNVCPGFWHEEYRGYLVAQYHGFRTTEYVCMDEAPVGLTGGHEDKSGALFYYQTTKCGALKCPPYAEDREITCVVCSS